MKKITYLTLLSGLFLSVNTALACDDRSCEIAYLNSSEQYIDVESNQALAAQKERIAYAKIREQRQIKVNEQLVREARERYISLTNKAIAEGKSFAYVESKMNNAYKTGAIKAQPIPLDDVTERHSVSIDLPNKSKR